MTVRRRIVVAARIVGLLLALATISSLELIQWIGASTDPPRPPWFAALTGFMDLCLVGSSAIFAPALLRQGRGFLGSLFGANLGLMLAAAVLRLSGVEFSRPVLFGVGLYWLSLYLLGLPAVWNLSRGRSPDEPGG